MTVRVRFAPSPTGHLHVGNARTALFNWLYARKHGGVFILRIEDTDLVRSEERFEDLIYQDLKWLEMDWDEGPDCGGQFGPYRQSERTEIYKEKALQLIESGRAYYCFCVESELEQQAAEAKAAGLTWKYPRTCRNLSRKSAEDRMRKGESFVIRLEVRPGPIWFDDLVHGSMEFDSNVISDLILIRSNGLPTYNYAVVVDDALMEITHIIRGDDHLSNTPNSGKRSFQVEQKAWSRFCAKLPENGHPTRSPGELHCPAGVVPPRGGRGGPVSGKDHSKL